MKSIRNVDVLYTIHEKSRVLEECICRVESACDTGHFESVNSALRTKPELRAALGAYIRQMLALLGMLTPQAYSTASLDVRDIQDLLQALQWEPDRVSAFWPDLCDACRTLYRLSGEQLDIYVRLTQPAYAADLHLVEPDTLPPSWQRNSNLEYQTSLTQGQPDDEAVRLLQYYEALALENDPRGYCVCTSEGKDSRVLGHLFRRAGVKHFYQHSITGIEPPELIYFQRSNFQQYRDAGYLTYDVMYRKSMWQLMLEKKIPPLRTIRYCCAELKEKRSEHQGKAVVSFGVRKYESVKRARSRNELEIALPRQKNLIMPFDDGENRKIFELCYRDREKRVNPLAYWTDADIWNYSRDVKLEQCSLYSEGFDRLGCIGCPLAREQNRRREFSRWPKFYEQYLRTFDRMLERRRQCGDAILDYASTAEIWMEWWLSDHVQETAGAGQLSLYEL